VATAAQKNEGGKASWHVRNEQGERFGPVDFETLKSWASDGRLAPTNEVSENGTDWHLATAQRGLEMDWVAEVTPGTFYGPIHQVAMEELAKEGSLAGQSAFFMRSKLGARHEQEQRVRHVEQERQKLKEQLEAAHGRLAELERQAKQAQDQLAAREGELLQARRDQALAAEALAAEQAGRAAQAAALSEQAQRFEAERQTLQAAVRRAEAGVAQGAARMAELEGALAGAEQAAGLREAAEKQVRALGAELAAVKAELAEVRQAARQARAQDEAAAEALETARRELADEARQASALKDELSAARKELAAAQRRNDDARALARQALEVLDASGEAPAVETLAAEPQERACRPSARAKSSEPFLEAEVLPPERLKPAAEKPPVVSHANRAKPGLSLTELEHQARRELERLGAQGKTFFAKKK